MLKDYRGSQLPPYWRRWVSQCSSNLSMPLCHFEIQKKSDGFNPGVSDVIIVLERTSVEVMMMGMEISIEEIAGSN
jgi:hypothetical protein